jgi:hypothetical protein
MSSWPRRIRRSLWRLAGPAGTGWVEEMGRFLEAGVGILGVFLGASEGLASALLIKASKSSGSGEMERIDRATRAHALASSGLSGRLVIAKQLGRKRRFAKVSQIGSGQTLRHFSRQQDP